MTFVKLMHILNVAFLLVTLLQRIVILSQNLYCWFRYGRTAELPAWA